MSYKLSLTLSTIFCAAALTAAASPVVPTYTSFGTLSGATFSGSGIANTATAITTGSAGGYAVTLGLTATPKYPAQPVGQPLLNDGAGIFYSSSFADTAHPTWANWNFDFYVNLAGQGDLTGYVFTLLYGINGQTLQSLVLNIAGAGTTQDSYNLGFLSVPGFSPTANNQYVAELTVTSPTGANALTDAILINTVPDGASTVGLLACGLGGLVLINLVKNRSQKA